MKILSSSPTPLPPKHQSVIERMRHIQQSLPLIRQSVGNALQSLQQPSPLIHSLISMNSTNSQSSVSSISKTQEPYSTGLRQMAYQLSSGLQLTKKNIQIHNNAQQKSSKGSNDSIYSRSKDSCFVKTCEQLMSIQKMRNQKKIDKNSMSEEQKQKNKSGQSNSTLSHTDANIIIPLNGKDNKNDNLVKSIEVKMNPTINVSVNNKDLKTTPLIINLPIKNHTPNETHKINTSNASNTSNTVKTINKFNTSNAINTSNTPPSITATTMKNTLQTMKEVYNQKKQTRALQMIRTLQDTPPPLSINDFQLLRFIQKGQLGQVYLSIHTPTNFLCAIKIIDKTCFPHQSYDQLARQVKIHSFLSHQNIIRLYSAFSDQQYLYLILQYCCDGNLYSYLKKQHRLPEKKVRDVVRQLCSALQYMHSHDIIHRDIKPQNILLQGNIVKLCDFGWSVYSPLMRNTRCGSPLYSSPQLIKEIQYDNKIDIWNVGMLTYELLYGRVPFEIRCEEELIRIVEDQVYFPRKDNVSEVGKEFIMKCLEKEGTKRISIFQLIDHEFVR